MKRLGIVFLLLMAVAVYGQQSGLVFSVMNYGQAPGLSGARSLGLGGSGIAAGSAGYFSVLNPALIADTEHLVQGVVSGQVHNYEEDRAFPYYDNFGGFVDYGSYVFNSDWYQDFALATTFKLPAIENVDLYGALSVHTLSDYNYDYLEEVRTTGFSDVILAYNKINSEGRLRSYNLGVAARPLPDLTVGLTLGLIQGDITQKAEIDSVDQSMDNIGQIETRKITLPQMSLRFSLGATYQVNNRLRAGAVIQLPFEIETNNDYRLQTQDVSLVRPLDIFGSAGPLSFSPAGSDSLARSFYKQTLSYPLSLGLGLEYRFKNLLEARISADFEYIFWSDFEDSHQPDLIFSDVYVIRTGIEHVFFDRMPFRVGFSYQPLKENRQYARTVLTAGIGLIFETFIIDIGAGLESLDLNELDIFDNGKYPPLDSRADPLDRVETDNFYGVMDIRFSLDKLPFNL